METVKKERPIKAKVWEVRNGPHGKYAVCGPVYEKDKRKIKGTVTISLEETDGIWQEEKLPKRADRVLLYGVREREYGWVADKATFSRL